MNQRKRNEIREAIEESYRTGVSDDLIDAIYDISIRSPASTHLGFRVSELEHQVEELRQEILKLSERLGINMSHINNFKCNSCEVEVPAKWNGEHFLMPDCWVEFYNNKLNPVHYHLCWICYEALLCGINLKETKHGKKVVKSKNV